MQRKRQERATTLIQRTGAKILDWLRRGAAVTTAGAKALTSFFLAAGGAVTAFVLFSGIVLVAALMASPFGILFANEPSPDTIPLNAAVAEVSKEVCSTLTELQDGNYDSIDLTGALPGWREVIAVFAVRTAGAENGVDVATMDADRVDRLKTVFWDMTEITSEVDTIYHDGGENGEDWTEHILHLAVAAKSAEEMSTDYRFTAYQKRLLPSCWMILRSLMHCSMTSTACNTTPPCCDAPCQEIYPKNAAPWWNGRCRSPERSTTSGAAKALCSAGTTAGGNLPRSQRTAALPPALTDHTV